MTLGVTYLPDPFMNLHCEDLCGYQQRVVAEVFVFREKAPGHT